MPDKVQHIRIGGGDDGIRLDRWFKRHFSALPHARLENMLRRGEIKLDSGRVQASTRIREGQMLRLAPFAYVQTEPSKSGGIKLSAAQKKNLLSCVIFYDEKIIVFNKPAGLAVQGGTKTRHHLDAMLDALKLGGGRPHLAHRLDKDTSGILLLARSANDAAELSQIFRRQKIKKTYWALTHGLPKPPEGKIILPIAEREAVTHYQIIQHVGRSLAWVEFLPLTGRTHQIRLHAAHMGAPIIGDRRHGHREKDKSIARALGNVARLHLHARAIALPDGRRFSAPLPPHMAQTWKNLGFDNPH